MKKHKPNQIVLILVCITVLVLFSSPEIKAVSCSCASYPCSTNDCNVADQCDGLEFQEFTGTCESDGFGGGLCEFVGTSCGDYCIASFGCAECTISGDCTSDFNYCSGSQIYERDFYCNLFSYSCDYDNNFIDDCDDYDGNACNGQLRELRDYGCSGGECSYSVTTTTDCSVYTTAYSSPYCIDSDTSRKTRDLGVCDLFEFTFCDTVTDNSDTDCDYGCGIYFNEKEYEYQCTNYLTYYLYERDIEGYCRIDNSIAWSVTGSVKYCGSNTFCGNDEIISSNSNVINPCITFNPSTLINQTQVVQNSPLSVKTVSTQLYPPDIVCYDFTSDGVYDVCHGTGCDLDIENTYCDGESCCSSESYSYITSINTSIDYGTYYLKYMSLESSKNLNEIGSLRYIISPSFVRAVILNDSLQVEKNTMLELESTFYGSPSVTSVCWSDSFYKRECYGDVLDCASECIGYDYISSNKNADFQPDTSVLNSRVISFKVTNGNESDIDTINLCVSDFGNDIYCGTCDDGIKNDDETGIDENGHCGNCNDGIRNGAETYIDYGGNCGTCYDDIKQNFELLDVDYGGICGNCSINKTSDDFWSFGHGVDDTIPFDTEYCGDKTTSIIGIVQVVIIIISGLFLILFFIAFGSIIYFIITLGITFTTAIIKIKNIIKDKVFIKK